MAATRRFIAESGYSGARRMRLKGDASTRSYERLALLDKQVILMNATPVSQVRDVAEAGEVMPQKSTFFYPKVLTGLAIHTLEPDREVPPV